MESLEQSGPAPIDEGLESTVPSDALPVARKGAVFRPIGSPRPSEVIVSRIQSAIGLGLFADEEPLPRESDLAELFGTTPFAVREALGILRDEGLVETRRGRTGGSVIRLPEGRHRTMALKQLARLSSVELRDASDWRGLLTVGAVHLAATRASARNVRRLRDYAERIHEGRGKGDVSAAHSRFHFELAAASQSVRISAAEMELQTELGWLFSVILDDPDYRESSSRVLLDLVDAMERRDREMAVDVGSSWAQNMMTAVLDLHLTLDQEAS